MGAIKGEDANVISNRPIFNDLFKPEHQKVSRFVANRILVFYLFQVKMLIPVVSGSKMMRKKKA